jgi:hypothetical protein
VVKQGKWKAGWRGKGSGKLGGEAREVESWVARQGKWKAGWRGKGKWKAVGGEVREVESWW